MAAGGLRLAVLAIACAVLGIAAAPGIARSQAIQVRVVDSSSMSPLGGALVALVDSHGTQLGEGLSSENGFRTFFVPPGQYRVRVRRIGYLPYVSAFLEMAPARMLTVAVQSRPVVLSTIVISGRTSCRSLPSGSTQALATVWGEATKALEASRLTMADLRGVGTAWTYAKTVGVPGARDTTDTSYFTVTDRPPFGAVDPDTLAAAGYVTGNSLSGWMYFGPDETVLLSPSFARTHCFRLVRDGGVPGMIGVAFEPVPGRRMADIAGVAWLDERTSELRRIVFRYVNAGHISRYGGGGETNFRRLPSGAWLINSWHLRAPNMTMRSGVVRPIGFYENGGGVLERD